MMSESIQDNIVEFVKNSGKSRLNVTWFGGEPLLGISCIERLTDMLIPAVTDYSASMITNGYLLSDRIIEKLNHLKISSIQITLDGCADVHDSRRCLKNGKKTFDTIISNITRVNKIAPNVRINVRVNLDKTNINGFIDLYKYLKNLKCRNLAILPAFVNDSTETKSNPCVCNSSEQFSFISKMFKQHGIIVFPLYPSPHRNECAVRGNSAIVIGPEGELYKCWQDVGDKSRVYGNISGQISNEVILSEYLMMADPFDDEECRNCLLLPICSGGCPYERIKYFKDSKTNKPCPLIKNKLSEFLIMYYKSKQQ